MEQRSVYVGLDYHKSAVQVCVLDGSGEVLMNRSCENDAGRIVEAAGRHGRVHRAAIEACCGSADLAEELVEAGWSVDIAHPGYVARMKRGPDKTDFTDARMLADLTRVGYLPRVWLAPEAIRELRRLTRHRQTLVDQRRSTRLRMRALLREQRLRGPARAWSVRWMVWLAEEAPLGVHGRWVMDRHLAAVEWITQEVRAVEARLRQATRHDPLVARLLGQPGIGEVTAWTIRAEIGRFDRFRTGKQLARFCGLTPRNASSGERRADAGLIKAGSRRLRAVLIEAAHRLARYHPHWREMNVRLRAAGKPGSVVAAAIANRWTRRLYWEMTAVQTN